MTPLPDPETSGTQLLTIPRKKLAATGIEVVAKAPPANSKGGTYRRTDFETDDILGVPTCPAGREPISSQASQRDAPLYRLNRWSPVIEQGGGSGCGAGSYRTGSRGAVPSMPAALGEPPRLVGPPDWPTDSAKDPSFLGFEPVVDQWDLTVPRPGGWPSHPIYLPTSRWR